MKKLLFTTLIFLSLAFVGFSQTIPPPYINYQAVLYDVNGANPNNPLINQSFTTFVNINDELGNLLYREEHYASTDANGLITVKMGDGLYTAGPITNFNQIDWGVGKYYLVVDFDINGTISSTAPEQLVTVPYSFFAGKAGNGMTAVADNGNGTLTFMYANGATYTTPTLAGIQGPAGPVGPSGASGATGADGQSAYDLWLAQGNTGTVQDFLSTSAYQIWLAQGNTGTAQDFLNTLVGPSGPQGIQGIQGIPGTNGTNGTNGATGPQGSQGIQGVTGVNGVNGTDGRSAYEIAVLNGFVGTETQWLLSLVGATGTVGATGAQGPQGIQGPVGNDGATGAQGPTGLIASGTTAGNTAYWDGTAWVTNNSNIFNNGGNVGIGTTNPTVKLEVNGRLKTQGINELSDVRYKKDIQTLTNALANIEKLRGVSYDWKQAEFPEKNFDAKHQIGLIAQELELVFPELVNTDAEGYKSVDYSKLVAVLIEAVKEQQTEITTLQGQVQNQATEMSDLKASVSTIFDLLNTVLPAQMAEK
jgi:hypothetical protein